MKILLVASGGAVGSVLRYLVGQGVQQLTRSPSPWATLLVNMAGCFAIGFLAQLAEGRTGLSPETRLFTMVGVLGGFTTFSSFGNETFQLFRDGRTNLALVNVAVQVVAGLAFVGMGRIAARPFSA